MKNLTKLGVASALISVSLLFCACSSNESKIESLIKEKYPNAKILSFDEAKKELGLTNKECLDVKVESNGMFTVGGGIRFVKMADGQFMALSVLLDIKDNKLSRVDREYTVDVFKELRPNCFK